MGGRRENGGKGINERKLIRMVKENLSER